MTIQDDFTARFPDEFDQATVDQYLPVLTDVWPAYYGGRYEHNKEIVLNLIAHLLVMETSSGTGPLQAAQSKSAGSVSASYHARQGGPLEDFFGATKYGQRYLMLTRSRVGGFFV